MTREKSGNNGRGRKGLLIAFEGIDGVGKTTQLQLVAKDLARMGYDIISTKEPTDGPFGRKIRQMFASRDTFSHEEEMELFMEDRREHVQKLINPALEKGKIVLTDRYYFSTAAYQGAAGGNEEDILKKNEAFAPSPDLVILLIGEPSLGIHRIQTLRHEELNDFEQESNLMKVAAAFNRLNRDCIRRVEASEGVDEIHKNIMEHVKSLL